MRKIIFVIITAFLCGFTIGCTHYSSKLPLGEDLNAQVQNKIAVAGILDRRSVNGARPALSVSATKLLVEEAKIPDVSGQLNNEELSLLLAQPLELAVTTRLLKSLGQRIGQRYVVVGEQGAYPITELTVWDSLIVIPAGYVVVWFTVPIPISQQHGIMHATRVLRVIDLDQARIVGESFALLRDKHDAGEFTRGEISDGLSNINLERK
jgi:hypothetical protein